MSRYRTLSRIDTLVVHCAATPNGRAVPIEEIDRWHRARGFERAWEARVGAGPWAGRGPHQQALEAIGYHFVIGVHGVTDAGRRLTETGAHARGWNTRGVGICLVGTDRFTIGQWETLRALVRSLPRKLPRLHHILGHRDLPGVHKSCPGFDVAAWLAADCEPPAEHILEAV